MCKKMISHKIEVRFNDFDGMGHVNNAVFLTYLEVGRINFMKHVLPINIDKTEFFNRKFDFILANVAIDYKLPIEQQFIVVDIWVSKIGTSSFEFSYKIVDEKKEIIYANAKSVQVCYDYKLKKTIPIVDEFRAILEKELVISQNKI